MSCSAHSIMQLAVSTFACGRFCLLAWAAVGHSRCALPPPAIADCRRWKWRAAGAAIRRRWLLLLWLWRLLRRAGG